jgi:hypothetical protein
VQEGNEGLTPAEIRGKSQTWITYNVACADEKSDRRRTGRQAKKERLAVKIAEK